MNVPIKNNKCTQLPDNFFILEHTPLPQAKQFVSDEVCECGCRVQLEDSRKSEVVCPVCGLVKEKFVELSENNLVYGSWSKSDLYSGNCYTFSEKEFMMKKGIFTRTFTGNHELNNMDYKYIVDIFKVELCLSDIDIINLWRVVSECGGLKHIHSKKNYECVLLGICRFILIEKGVAGYLINLNNSLYREYNLTYKDYLIIERNIEKYRKLYRCNT